MKKLPIRIPTAKPTEWHKDKSKYSRKRKHKGDDYEKDSDRNRADNISGRY